MMCYTSSTITFITAQLTGDSFFKKLIYNHLKMDPQIKII